MIGEHIVSRTEHVAPANGHSTHRPPFLRQAASQYLAALALLGLIGLGACSTPAQAQTTAGQLLPTGQSITPTAVPGATFQPLATNMAGRRDYIADGAAAAAISPDGKSMLVLTSGYNVVNGADSKRRADLSKQYILVYDITGNAPRRRQTLTIANAFGGIAWSPDGSSFYVGGGVDDAVQAYSKSKGRYAPDGAPIPLGHKAGLGADVKPQAGGLAVSPSGKRLLVANYYNDSVSLIDTATRKVVAERDLRPGKNDAAKRGVPGGEFPVAVAWRDDSHAFVSAARDREIIALDVHPTDVTIATRTATVGEPTSLLINRAGDRLYAVEDNDDRLAILNAATGALAAEPHLGLPEGLAGANGPAFTGKGVNPDSLAFGPDDSTLLVTYGGINALAIVSLKHDEADVVGLIPTGWYPSAVAVRGDGRRIFVANRKSPPGPNPNGCGPRQAMVQAQSAACGSANQYIYQLEKAGLLSFPPPDQKTLARLTLQVADNIGATDGPVRAAASAVMARVAEKIKHVVFIVKENRTYDQVLGDLEVGNGDPRLAILGGAMTPNHHQLARQFVTFDNFYDSGEQSSTGWNWSTAARATDLMERTASVNYAGRGLSYEAEGTDRNVNVALAMKDRDTVNSALPDDPDLLPGKAHLTSPDGDDDDEQGEGFLWDGALRAGLTVRNYGFMSEGAYDPKDPKSIPPIRDPFREKRTAYVSANQSLAPVSDPYFRGFDQAFPDYWRYKEWEREFDLQVSSRSMPALTLLRISHDHFGDFGTAIDGVDTVQKQMADNDYALGLIVQKIAASPFAGSTLVFVIEDDAQNGADHVDARRSLAFIVGPYVKQKALVTTRYTTVSLLRTIEEILRIPPLGLNDALAAPMSDAFDLGQSEWSYQASVPDVLRTTQLPLPPRQHADTRGRALCPMHDAAWWGRAMAGQNFAEEDRLDTDAFNHALWAGLAGEGAPPPERTGLDLRAGRAALLASVHQDCPDL
ncbi:MAG: hypothetical protein GC155_13380 [Alphaproteobacteria bacterium]|nr:hypothetical protein [Alphaproteobacteria bacterium]